MEILVYFFIFILGSAIGSFLGVVVDRLPHGESIFKGRSHCNYCKKTLSPLDLIPIFSFIFLKGRCRFCKAELSSFYPVIEIATGVLFVLIFFLNHESGIMNYGFDIAYYPFIVSALIALFFIDFKYGILPFSIVFPATIITFLYFILNTKYLILGSLLAAIGAFLFFLALFLITRGRGMGFGDVVYAFFMGLLLGFPKIILGLYIAFISGAVFSLILIATKKKKLKGSTIAFGPFLVTGTIISLLYGEKIIKIVISWIPAFAGMTY